jgi:hypothetical protein
LSRPLGLRFCASHPVVGLLPVVLRWGVRIQCSRKEKPAGRVPGGLVEISVKSASSAYTASASSYQT